jgi:hypothetical protein
MQIQCAGSSLGHMRKRSDLSFDELSWLKLSKIVSVSHVCLLSDMLAYMIHISIISPCNMHAIYIYVCVCISLSLMCTYDYVCVFVCVFICLQRVQCISLWHGLQETFWVASLGCHARRQTVGTTSEHRQKTRQSMAHPGFLCRIYLNFEGIDILDDMILRYLSTRVFQDVFTWHGHGLWRFSLYKF